MENCSYIIIIPSCWNHAFFLLRAKAPDYPGFKRLVLVRLKSSPERDKNFLTAFYPFPNKTVSFLSFYFTKLELNFLLTILCEYILEYFGYKSDSNESFYRGERVNMVGDVCLRSM